MNKFKKMKRLLLFAVIIFSILPEVYSQAKNSPIDFYPHEYDKLSYQDWPAIKETFETFLAFKSYDEVRNYADHFRASFTLARMVKINWDGSLKNEISSYLTYFFDQLIQGNSYLNINTVTIPEYVSIHDPIMLPHNIIWALFQINAEAACKIIKTYWITTSNLAISSYQGDLREFTLWLFENTNNKAAEEFFLENYSLLKDNLSGEEKNLMSAVKLKCEISGMNDQKKAWEYLWNVSKLDNSTDLDEKAQFLWYKNILMMKQVYGDLDNRTIVKISDKTDSANKKYLFLYSACFNINSQLTSGRGYKIDRSIINDLDRAVNKMESQRSSLKSLSTEKDFLRVTYDLMKSNVSKTAE
jgi:hypothetical protein